MGIAAEIPLVFDVRPLAEKTGQLRKIRTSGTSGREIVHSPSISALLPRSGRPETRPVRGDFQCVGRISAYGENPTRLTSDRALRFMTRSGLSRPGLL